MKQKPSRLHFLVFFATLSLMSIPKSATESLQGNVVALLSPFWSHLLAVKSISSSDKTKKNPQELKLTIENALLREEILNLKNIMQHEFELLDQMQLESALTTKNLKKRHHAELLKLLQVELQAIPAQVIFRSPSTWSSSLWINVGQETNVRGAETIVKNSPVLFGKAVVGLIDYVGKKQSRVRLITDSRLTPSVRAARGDIKAMLNKEKLRDAIKILYAEGNAFDDAKQQDELIEKLEALSEKLFPETSSTFLLAKGEIHGSSKPLWRTERHKLSGTGFNYDFADSFGPARDLRTGKALSCEETHPQMPIIEAGDILITTGLDGVFPPGLPVAEVTHVYPLNEGDYYYEIEALPVAGNMDDLSLVFVIPPLSLEDEGMAR